MEIITKLPTDLFKHTMKFYNPVHPTAQLLKELHSVLGEAEKYFHRTYPYRFERKGFQATCEMIEGFQSYCRVELKHKGCDVLNSWATNQFICW